METPRHYIVGSGPIVSHLGSKLGKARLSHRLGSPPHHTPCHPPPPSPALKCRWCFYKQRYYLSSIVCSWLTHPFSPNININIVSNIHLWMSVSQALVWELYTHFKFNPHKNNEVQILVPLWFLSTNTNIRGQETRKQQSQDVDQILKHPHFKYTRGWKNFVWFEKSC